MSLRGRGTWQEHPRELCLLFNIVQDNSIFGSNGKQRPILGELYAADNPV